MSETIYQEENKPWFVFAQSVGTVKYTDCFSAEG